MDSCFWTNVVSGNLANIQSTENFQDWKSENLQASFQSPNG